MVLREFNFYGKITSYELL